VSQSGAAGVGNTTASQLAFLKTMLDNDVGKIFYLANGGNGYDSHADQSTGSTNLSQ